MIAKAFQKPVTKKYIVEHNMQIDSAFQWPYCAAGKSRVLFFAVFCNDAEQ